MPATPQDAAARCAQLTRLTEALTARITAESVAFEQRRPQDVAAGQEETARLANHYRHESGRTRADPGLIAQAPLSARQALTSATIAFEAALARHGRALEAARTVTEGLVRAIAEEVSVSRASGAGYGPGARATAADARAVAYSARA